MTWRTHWLIGLNSLWLLQPVWQSIPQENFGLLMLAASLGSLLPDLDAPSSKLQHMKVSGTGIRPFALASQVIRLTSGHRGWTHSAFGLLAATALFLPCAFIAGWEVWAAFAFGYASHLVADSLTPTGIPVFATKRRQRLLPKSRAIATGSEWEELLFVLSAVAALCLLLMVLLLMTAR